MKAITPLEFLALLDDEFAWRRKELTSVWADVKSAADKSRSARLRAGVAMLYAHWEGFIKMSSEAFVEFVAQRRFKHTELSHGLLALALRSRLHEFGTESNVLAHIDFIRFILNDFESRARLPKLGAIRTGNNLNSKRLKEIVFTLGLDYSLFELKENLIDAQLLNWRNTIAHGKWLCPQESDFELLYQEVSGLLRSFKDQLANIVILEAYKKT